MLVGFGQTVCLPTGPRCDICDVAKVDGLCPSRGKPKVSRSPKKKVLATTTGEAAVKIEIEEDSAVKVTDIVKREVVEDEKEKVPARGGRGVPVVA
jgi:endonuclease-3